MESEKKKISCEINGKRVEIDRPMSVFQAAQEAGIEIPHYCYHPDLSVAGVCRMCLVDVEGFPRLTVSCNTPVSDKMVVKTDSPKVKDAVKGVLELHLINHPLDCPICDKAGECGLQNFYAKYGLYESRMDFEKVHKPKVIDIGTIVLDSERCILCTRCVRFTDEVTKTHELRILNRGDRSELRTFDGGPLRNDYTGNLADICPVGALTAKDFRFKQRVWFLEKASSICTLCARGCNTEVSIDPDTKHLYRVEPRRNPQVNASWICDEGRWGYGYLTNESRIKTPVGKGVEWTWEAAFKCLSERIAGEPEKTLVALGGYLTNEEIVDVLVSFSQLGVKKFTWVVDEEVVEILTPKDGILKHADRSPNAKGLKTLFKSLGVTLRKIDEVKRSLKDAEFSTLLVLGIEGQKPQGVGRLLEDIPKTTFVVVHATNLEASFESADLLLPNVSSYEKSGTMVNALGMIQRVFGALPAQHLARNAHHVVFGLGRGHDREPLEAHRMEQIYQKIVSEKLLGESHQVRELSPLGKTLNEGALKEMQP